MSTFIPKQMSEEEHLVNQLDWAMCRDLLEGICIQCYDDDTVEVLREAVRSNLKDGNLYLDDVREVAERR